MFDTAETRNRRELIVPNDHDARDEEDASLDGCLAELAELSHLAPAAQAGMDTIVIDAVGTVTELLPVNSVTAAKAKCDDAYRNRHGH